MSAPTGSAAFSLMSYAVESQGQQRKIKWRLEGTMTAVDGDQAGGNITVLAECYVMCSVHSPPHQYQDALDVGQTTPNHPLTKTFNTGDRFLNLGQNESGIAYLTLQLRAINSSGSTVLVSSGVQTVTVP